MSAKPWRQLIVNRYQRDFPEACCGLLDDAEASLKHLYSPQRHQPYVRTSNLTERTFEEERRRTKVIPHLWDESSVVQLVFAVLIRVSERWGKRSFSAFEQHQIHSLRRQQQLEGPPGVAAPPPSLTRTRRVCGHNRWHCADRDEGLEVFLGRGLCGGHCSPHPNRENVDPL